VGQRSEREPDVTTGAIPRLPRDDRRPPTRVRVARPGFTTLSLGLRCSAAASTWTAQASSAARFSVAQSWRARDAGAATADVVQHSFGHFEANAEALQARRHRSAQIVHAPRREAQNVTNSQMVRGSSWITPSAIRRRRMRTSFWWPRRLWQLRGPARRQNGLEGSQVRPHAERMFPSVMGRNTGGDGVRKSIA